MTPAFIPWKVDSGEIIVRAILSPFHYSESGNKLKREAFLPPPNSAEVSLVRLKYSTDDKCKTIAKDINFAGNIYVGLAATYAVAITTLFQTATDGFQRTRLKATPIKPCAIQFLFPAIPTLLYQTPEHADLLYQCKVVKGKPQTEMRRLANEIVKVFNFRKDQKPFEATWQEGELAELAAASASTES